MTKAILHLRKADPVLAGVIDRVGPYGQQFAEPGFLALARAIVGQQLAGAAAATIWGRFHALLDSRGSPAKSVLTIPIPKLRAAGLSGQKAAYIRDLAARTASGALRFNRLPAMSEQEVIDALTQVKGIGVWTAHMFLIFALRRPDVLPVGDLGIRAAMKKAYGLTDLPKPAEMERIAQPWRPWTSIACWYLWQSLKPAPPTAPAAGKKPRGSSAPATRKAAGGTARAARLRSRR